MNLNKYIFFSLFTIVLFAVQACKKEIQGGKEEEKKVKEVCDLTNDPLEIQIRDSVFYFTKLFSLWEEYLPPKNVNDIDKQSVVQRYTLQYCTGEDVLRSLKNLTPLRGSDPIDRFSFLDRAGEVSEEIQGGMVTSFGMYVFYLMRADNSDADLYVRMVDKGSPAYKAGIKRGTRILSMNGNSNISYNVQQAKDFKDVDDALSSSKMDVIFVNPNEEVKEKEIYNIKYDTEPILVDTVYSIENRKVGYFAYNSFISVDSENGDRLTSKHYHQLKKMFDNFESKNINELIVDLRYNGGGSVNTAEYIANRLAPIAADGQRMYDYKVNRYLEDWEWNAPGGPFAPVGFEKEGSLNLSKVYFLVSQSTASASELLINVLEPYLDVQLIGTYGTNSQGQSVKENTYGKPVGFFGWPIVDDKTELYVTSFQMTNKDGKSDYFEGLIPDHHTYEGFLNDFGDTEEDMIASALNHIFENNFQTSYRQLYARSKPIAKERNIAIKNFKSSETRNNMYKFFTQKPQSK